MSHCAHCGCLYGHRGWCSDPRWSTEPVPRTVREQRPARGSLEQLEAAAVEVFVMLEATPGLTQLQRAQIVIGCAAVCWGWPDGGSVAA
ncbi:MAG TPA: hypothetical protein VLC09_20110 [Polyangiaceae bacterium]|nr:hypothetical protein [Polyangiaceae bacterium]